MALRQCIMLLAIVLASATVAAAAPAQLHYSSHLAVLHEMLVAGAADPTNELTVPLPNPLSPSGAAAANVAAGNSDNATDRCGGGCAPWEFGG